MRLPIVTAFLILMAGNPLMAQRSQTAVVDVSLPAALAPAPLSRTRDPLGRGTTFDLRSRDVVSGAVIGVFAGALAGYLVLRATATRTHFAALVSQPRSSGVP